MQVENDTFDGASDAYYTHGAQLIYAPDHSIDWPKKILPFIPADREIRSEYFLGQAIFTPYEIGKTELLEYDRPYAGWLYLGAALLTRQVIPSSHINTLERFEINLGIVGPSSQAQLVQQGVHSLVGGYDVNGWDNQLRDELAIMASYAKKWTYSHALGQSGVDWEIGGTLGGSVGNVNTQLLSGFGLRFGTDLYSSVGINGVPPTTAAPHDSTAFRSRGWYLFTDWQLRYVARDIFLDGNTFKDSHSVEKQPLVGEWSFGLSFSGSRYRLLFYHTLRSQEFESQYENASFSGLSLTSFF